MKFRMLIILVYNYLFLIREYLAESNDNNNDTILLVAEKVSTEENGGNLPAGVHINTNSLETNGDVVHDEKNEDSDTMMNENKKQNHMSSNVLITVVDNSNDSNNNNDDSNETTPAQNEKVKENLGISYAPNNDVDKVREKYKSYKELKKSFESIRKEFQTDAEIILQLLEKFKNITKKSKGNPQVRSNLQMKILYNLNYLMSQIDNAILFADKGGLEFVLLPVIVNSTDVNVRVEAMRVLGAMTQNNPSVQVKVFERNFGPYLIQILMSSTNTEELSTALTAIGSLIRKFPYAQLKLLPTSGIPALISLLSKDCEMKIKAKVVTIISDMIIEKILIMENASSNDSMALAQYKLLNYTKWLQDNSYCDAIDTVITNNIHHFWDAPDLMEYFMYCIGNTRSICSIYWSQNIQFRQNLLTLQQHYADINDEYYTEVADLIADVSDSIYDYKEFKKHDEL